MHSRVPEAALLVLPDLRGVESREGAAYRGLRQARGDIRSAAEDRRRGEELPPDCGGKNKREESLEMNRKLHYTPGI